MKKLLLSIMMLASGHMFAQEAVDLGLSVKWGDRNIGASSPYEAGEYIAWGETSSKDAYRYGPKNYVCDFDFKKYNSIEGDKRYDAAAKRLGGYWRMPTPEECRELFGNSKLKRIFDETLNKEYWEVIGPNGNKLIFPIAGHKHENGVVEYRGQSEFWTSRYKDDNQWDGDAFSAVLSKDFVGTPWAVEPNATYVGLNIRPVYDTIKEMENSNNPIIKKIGFAKKCVRMANEESYQSYVFGYLRQAVEAFEEVGKMTGYDKYISERELKSTISNLEGWMKSLYPSRYEKYKAEKNQNDAKQTEITSKDPSTKIRAYENSFELALKGNIKEQDFLYDNIADIVQYESLVEKIGES